MCYSERKKLKCLGNVKMNDKKFELTVDQCSVTLNPDRRAVFKKRKKKEEKAQLKSKYLK